MNVDSPDRTAANFERRLASWHPLAATTCTAAFTFVPLALAGERSRLPGVQGRVAWQRGDNDRGASLGLSGHYSRERPLDVSVTSYAAAVDFHVQGERVGVAGEAFFGDNLDAFGGALSQVSESAGGFLETRLRPARAMGSGFWRWDGSTKRSGSVDPEQLRLQQPHVPAYPGSGDVIRVSMAGNDG